MEDKHIIMDDGLVDGGLVLSSGARKDLKTTGIWGILLSIFGFLYAIMIIFSGIMVLTMFQTLDVGIPTGQQGAMSGMGMFMIIGGLAFFVPAVYLLRFSINALRANSNMKTYTLTETLSHLKISFMTLGIMIMFSILLYFIWIAYMGVTASGAF